MNRAAYRARDNYGPDEHTIGGDVRKLASQPLEKMFGPFSGRP
jgi:hypothetical protein